MANNHVWSNDFVEDRTMINGPNMAEVRAPLYSPYWRIFQPFSLACNHCISFTNTALAL